jgi:cytochrome P450
LEALSIWDLPISSAMNDPRKVDIYSAAHKRDPFPLYSFLRSEAPVFEVRVPVLKRAWLITRYDDVVLCLKDSDRFVKNPRNAGLSSPKSMPRWTPASLRTLSENMLDLDEPAHQRQRVLINKAFSRARIEQLRNRVEVLAEDLVDRMCAKLKPDVIEDFALPLPLTVISELLGLPEEARTRFRRWTNVFLGARSEFRMALSLPSIFAFVRYLRRLVATRRHTPKDDLISALIAVEEGGDRLSEKELIAMLVLLIIAGHETTVNLIGSGTLALMENQHEKERLIGDFSLLGSAVEELLRFTAPVETATERYAAQDIDMHATRIRRGDVIFPVIASANRDAQKFAEPDRLDVARKPNPHLAFGDGVHYCVGSHLAKMEAEIAFGCLLRRLPKLSLACPAHELRWRAAPVVRGLKSLPVIT